MASNLDLLAHHEAGHAAIAWSFGLRLQSVTINPAHDNGETKTSNATRLQHALILLASSRAEAVLDPGCLGRRISPAMGEAELDRTISEWLESELPHLQIEDSNKLAEAIDRRLARNCLRLVRLHWEVIQRLAHELAQKGMRFRGPRQRRSLPDTTAGHEA